MAISPDAASRSVSAAGSRQCGPALVRPGRRAPGRVFKAASHGRFLSIITTYLVGIPLTWRLARPRDLAAEGITTVRTGLLGVSERGGSGASAAARCGAQCGGTAARWTRCGCDAACGTPGGPERQPEATMKAVRFDEYGG